MAFARFATRICIALLVGLCMSTTVFAEEMTVSAAASLKNAFLEMKTLFEKQQAQCTVHTNFAASNPLLKQLVEGAPGDVFASADTATMDKAIAAKVVDPASRTIFAKNDLVLIVPKGSPKPKDLGNLVSFAKIAIGNPDSVPAGRYAKEALVTHGMFEKLAKHYIYGNSVRQVLEYVVRGEVDAGFVYRTDAKLMADKVDIVMQVTGHTEVVYPIAVATTGSNAAMGQRFIACVRSPEGQAILVRYGFTMP